MENRLKDGISSGTPKQGSWHKYYSIGRGKLLISGSIFKRNRHQRGEKENNAEREREREFQKD